MLNILMSVPKENFKVHSTNVIPNQWYHEKNILTGFNSIRHTSPWTNLLGVFYEPPINLRASIRAFKRTLG